VGAAIGEELVYELAPSDPHETRVCTSPLLASPSVEAARALADLVEISPQLEAAAVVDEDGQMIGSVGVREARAAVLARAVRELLAGAAEVHSDGGRVTQLHATAVDGDVFAVSGEDGRTIVAVASVRGAPGLVFYDLKQCLIRLRGEPNGAA
jgi:predicted regulator of Ras-like GTPase activity (Roadblock/LC7/MglB family)